MRTRLLSWNRAIQIQIQILQLAGMAPSSTVRVCISVLLIRAAVALFDAPYQLRRVATHYCPGLHILRDHRPSCYGRAASYCDPSCSCKQAIYNLLLQQTWNPYACTWTACMHRGLKCNLDIRKKKNRDILSSQLRADQMPGSPWEGQLMCTFFLSMHQ